ncbi:hypothetical protein SAMN04487950_1336 [Halogranum rubrum]|uniref:DUF447 family protein n=1 Tax=Halogranum rubrum TaxID=553466 RepID=A0A1I4CRV1_9EURY|nr:DUF447 domain-containing protein [Halogranum rubrum]SFK83350.1 hypothetical protein SAMN04487950_1336 [Halogranum rubrum]
MSTERWPVELRGVTESVVATLGPNDLWNLAALGLHAPESEGEPVTATTWGNTRTRRNFHRQGGGVVQFTQDPREFVAAAATIHERGEPVLDGADAWVEVEAKQVDAGEDGGTRWERWELTPVESRVVRESVTTINRGFAAVIDATVAVSRLDVPAFDTEELLDRLEYFAETVEKCGGPREVAAFETLSEVSGWREYRDG